MKASQGLQDASPLDPGLSYCCGPQETSHNLNPILPNTRENVHVGIVCLPKRTVNTLMNRCYVLLVSDTQTWDMYQIFVNKNLKIKIILLYHIILMLFVLQKHLDISTLISEVEMYTKFYLFKKLHGFDNHGNKKLVLYIH